MAYTFTNDWFGDNGFYMSKFVLGLNEKKSRILEIGSFEGRSTFWLADNLLQHDESLLITIDPFVSDITCQVA